MEFSSIKIDTMSYNISKCNQYELPHIENAEFIYFVNKNLSSTCKMFCSLNHIVILRLLFSMATNMNHMRYEAPKMSAFFTILLYNFL